VRMVRKNHAQYSPIVEDLIAVFASAGAPA